MNSGNPQKPSLRTASIGNEIQTGQCPCKKSEDLTA